MSIRCLAQLAADHQRAGQHEERNRNQREALRLRDQLLDDQFGGETVGLQQPDQCAGDQRMRDRQAEHREQKEGNEGGQCESIGVPLCGQPCRDGHFVSAVSSRASRRIALPAADQRSGRRNPASRQEVGHRGRDARSNVAVVSSATTGSNCTAACTPGCVGVTRDRAVGDRHRSTHSPRAASRTEPGD